MKDTIICSCFLIKDIFAQYAYPEKVNINHSVLLYLFPFKLLQHPPQSQIHIFPK